MNIPEEVLQAVKSALRDEGMTDGGGNPHSWRCEHPDRYPNYCTCVDALARAALSAAAPTLMAIAWDEARDAYREDVSKGDVWRRNPYKESL